MSDTVRRRPAASLTLSACRSIAITLGEQIGDVALSRSTANTPPALAGADRPEQPALVALRHQLQPLRERFRGLLEHGTRGRHAKTARFPGGLLEELRGALDVLRSARHHPDEQ